MVVVTATMDFTGTRDRLHAVVIRLAMLRCVLRLMDTGTSLSVEKLTGAEGLTSANPTGVGQLTDAARAIHVRARVGRLLDE